MAVSYEKDSKNLFGDGSVRMFDRPVEEPPKSDPALVNQPRPAATYAHQDLLNRTNNLIQKSLAREYAAEQRRVENERMVKAREYDPSPSPTPSVSTDEEYDPAEFWHEDQVALNVILNARNEYSLMPSTWQIGLKGIPLPEGLFYVKTKNTSTRPRIYAHNEKLEFQGVQALRKLIDVHGRINDLRVKQVEALQNNLKTAAQRQNDESAAINDIARHLKKTLREAIRWAAKDGAIDVYGKQLPPNLAIIDLSEEQDTDYMHECIDIELNNLAYDWQEALEALPAVDGVDGNKPNPPVVFGLVIYKHILFIATLNGADQESVVHIPIQLNMEEKNQHQWNALAIILTICWARDIQMKMIAEMNLVPQEEAPSSDPDA
ncbi:hypothetical protein SLS62_003938 [Diatrype stigma]|uniref:Uncharacterized protein n=1 Tax=Diatrype stigma TaxID=117547 RepID=A0AAN9UVK6_9PEZI